MQNSHHIVWSSREQSWQTLERERGGDGEGLGQGEKCDLP